MVCSAVRGAAIVRSPFPAATRSAYQSRFGRDESCLLWTVEVIYVELCAACNSSCSTSFWPACIRQPKSVNYWAKVIVLPLEKDTANSCNGTCLIAILKIGELKIFWDRNFFIMSLILLPKNVKNLRILQLSHFSRNYKNLTILNFCIFRNLNS